MQHNVTLRKYGLNLYFNFIISLENSVQKERTFFFKAQLYIPNAG